MGVSGTAPGPVRLDFASGATVQQQAAAHAALALIDWTDEAAQNAWQDVQAGMDVPDDVKSIAKEMDGPSPLTPAQVERILKFCMQRQFPKAFK